MKTVEKQQSQKKRVRLVVLRSSVLLLLGLWMLTGQAQEIGRRASGALQTQPPVFRCLFRGRHGAAPPFARREARNPQPP